MQMSESFATTVAAVAPVVWLVSAVEHRQVVKWSAEAVHAGEVLLAETREDLQRASDAQVLTHQWNESQVKTLRAGAGRLLLLNLVWAAITSGLLCSMIIALEWLANGDEQNRAVAEAEFCYYVLCVSSILVTGLPVVAAVIEMFKSINRRRVLWNEIVRIEDEARGRMSNEQSPPA